MVHVKSQLYSQIFTQKNQREMNHLIDLKIQNTSVNKEHINNLAQNIFYIIKIIFNYKCSA